MNRPLSALIVSLALCAAPLVAEERVNPFAPPVVDELDAQATRTAPRRAAVFRHPRLRAVLHAMEGSMANLNGHIIGEKESALGYQLLAVQEHSADFLFRGSRIRLHVANDQGTSTP